MASVSDKNLFTRYAWSERMILLHDLLKYAKKSGDINAVVKRMEELQDEAVENARMSTEADEK